MQAPAASRIDAVRVRSPLGKETQLKVIAAAIAAPQCRFVLCLSGEFCVFRLHEGETAGSIGRSNVMLLLRSIPGKIPGRMRCAGLDAPLGSCSRHGPEMMRCTNAELLLMSAAMRSAGLRLLLGCMLFGNLQVFSHTSAARGHRHERPWHSMATVMDRNCGCCSRAWGRQVPAPAPATLGRCGIAASRRVQ